MTREDSPTCGQLLSELRSIIVRLREAVEARSDPALEEIANALDVICKLLARSWDRAAAEDGPSPACNG
ncbi:MAG: hypothetical protein ACRD0K_09390 [Egibacteraceae bacterium]